LRTNKIPVLLSGISLTKREEARKEFECSKREKRSNTNPSESFNSQLQHYVKADCTTGLLPLMEQVTSFLNNQTLEVALGYNGIGDYKLIKNVSSSQCEKSCKDLSSLLKNQVQRHLDSTFITDDIKSLFEFTISSMANISNEEGKRLEVEAQNILKKGYATLISGQGDVHKDVVTVWCENTKHHYSVSADKSWKQLHCFCKVR
jgi:hypothetical protein